MITYNIHEIAEVLSGHLIKQSGGAISYLIIDSRKVIFPRESLFFALRGERYNGHDFIEDIYAQGVRNFVVEQLPESIHKFARANFIQVSSGIDALQLFVAWHRSKFNIPVVGITGSNGKTMVKEWVFQALTHDKYVIRNPKSFNSQVGVPLSVWLLNSAAEIGVFEAGISKPGEMEKLEKIIKPTIGIITNIGDAHQENFQSVIEKLHEKMKLFKQSDTLIYCADDVVIGSAVAELFPEKKKLFSWGTQLDANLLIKQVLHKTGFTEVVAEYKSQIQKITIPFTDKASLENAIHVWSLLLVLGIAPEQIAKRLGSLEPVAMRLEVKEGNNNCTIINDSYNSDIESIHIALDFLASQHQHNQKVIILSDIAQSGFKPEDLYGRVSGILKQKGIDRFIGIGPVIMQHKALFDLNARFFETTQDFCNTYDFSKLNGMAILLKGARSFEFEQILAVIQKQTHRTVFEIDLNAISQNLNYFKRTLNPDTGIIAMLKASGYGSGTYEIANICQFNKVAAIAVAFTDEAIEMRRGGIKSPIIIMNPEEENYASMIAYSLEPQLFNFRSLKSFNEVAAKLSAEPYPVHIKLDTGMNRSGFVEDEMDMLRQILPQMAALRIKTIFSHLASADEPEQDDFTLLQVERFTAMSQILMQELPYVVKRHILNSAGIERFLQFQFDYVRLGIGMYGVSCLGEPLAPVGTLKSSIIQIKSVQKGNSIGYSRKGVAQTDRVIATVPIGYADGLRRILSNGVGKLWVNGKLAPIIGNVCMDMCMIDITGIEAHEGDSVEIFGHNISVNQMAEWMNTIPYEVLTGISKRVKRTYHFE